MKLISCHNGQLFTSLHGEAQPGAAEKVVPTGLEALDQIAPEGGLARGAVHELLWRPEHAAPRFAALTFATHPNTSADATGSQNTKVMIWCDPTGDVYPPAIAAAGVPLNRLYLLRPKKREDLIWSIAECLRCKGVGVTIAPIDRLSRIEARRLQLAAEQGGGMGLLMRPMIATRAGLQVPAVYAAATRWLVSPIPGLRSIQRWRVELLHGHGGRVGSSFILEHSHFSNRVRTLEKLPDQPKETAAPTGA